MSPFSFFQIKFADYTAEQCKDRWDFIQSHLRHYRLLGELLEDATEWVERPWYNFNKGCWKMPLSGLNDLGTTLTKVERYENRPVLIQISQTHPFILGINQNNQKHPGEPKKSLTSYMQFYMEQKDAVLKEKP